jgi:hypothetical protein
MVLTYEAFNETLESEKQKEINLVALEERFNNAIDPRETSYRPRR